MTHFPRFRIFFMVIGKTNNRCFITTAVLQIASILFLLVNLIRSFLFRKRFFYIMYYIMNYLLPQFLYYNHVRYYNYYSSSIYSTMSINLETIYYPLLSMMSFIYISLHNSVFDFTLRYSSIFFLNESSLLKKNQISTIKLQLLLTLLDWPKNKLSYLIPNG